MPGTEDCDDCIHFAFTHRVTADEATSSDCSSNAWRSEQFLVNNDTQIAHGPGGRIGSVVAGQTFKQPRAFGVERKKDRRLSAFVDSPGDGGGEGAGGGRR